VSELAESRDALERKRIENRKRLDAAELVIFGLPIPEKAKLLCLYMLRTCDWLTLTRDEGRAALSQILVCSEDQVSRYTRPLDQCGVIKIVGRGSNLTGLVHTYRIELDHRFWTGEPDEVAEVANAISRRIKKGPSRSGTTSRSSGRKPPSRGSAEAPTEYAAGGIGRERHAASGISESRPRHPSMPPAALEHAADAALPLLPPSSPSPPVREGGGEKSFLPEVLPDFPPSPIKASGLQGKTLNEIVRGHKSITDLEMKSLVTEFGLIKPDELIASFDCSHQWSWDLRDTVKRLFTGKYVFQVTSGKHDYCEQWCPGDPEVIAVTLRNIVAEQPDSPLGLVIKRHYPEVWPNSSSGDQTVDEEKAALQWLKDPDRSGTNSNFLNEKRTQVLAGRPLSPKQREAVVNNWKVAMGA
jgi:hypothetical protein